MLSIRCRRFEFYYLTSSSYPADTLLMQKDLVSTLPALALYYLSHHAHIFISIALFGRQYLMVHFFIVDTIH